MRKNIGALLVAAAIVPAAYAQSKMTIFGVADVGIAYGRGSIANTTQLLGSNLQSSRLGFRGTEDLGGGMAASFWLEASVAIDTGAGSATNTNNQASGATAGGALAFDRRSTVSLSSERLGEIRLGRDFTPHFLLLAQFDPFSATGTGASQITTGQRASGAAAGPWSRVGSTGPGVRASNGVAYFLPEGLGGVNGTVQYYMGENASNSATPNDGNGLSARLGWSGESLEVAGVYGKTKYATGDISSQVIGASYKFASIRLSAAYDRDNVSNGQPNGKGWLLGLNYQLPYGSIVTSFSNYKTSAIGSPGAKKMVLAYVHYLSTRTSLYAQLSNLKNAGPSAQALNAAQTSAEGSSTGLILGVRHTF